jgi:hypothetical protein
MNDKDWLQNALGKFNTDKPQWYGWRKQDDNGNDIPNNQRMTFENIILNDSTATMPTKAQVDAKIAELKQAVIDEETNKTSGKTKLKNLGLTDDEIKALTGK